MVLLGLKMASGKIVNLSPTYRVRSRTSERDLQQRYDPLDMMLSFSNDGTARDDEFHLNLFDTPEILTNPESPGAISNAMNVFLLAELNDRFGPMNSVEEVSTEILGLNKLNGTFIDSYGKNTTRIGTDARMKVIATFDQSPSPKTKVVLDTIKDIMGDMTYFVTNLTTSVYKQGEENELNGVYQAIRREIRPPTSENLSDDIDIIVDIKESEMDKSASDKPDDSKDSIFLISSTVPVVLGVAGLAAFLVFFVCRKKSDQVEQEFSKHSTMYLDVENGICSMDRSVDTSKSPASSPSQTILPPLVTDIQFNNSSDSQIMPANAPRTPGTPGTPGTAGSVFSGIDSEYGNSVLSPKSMSSPKSITTSYTCASESTIRASNLQKSKKKNIVPSIGASGSLFAFSEVAEEDYTTEDDIELQEQKSTVQKIGYNNDDTDGTESSSSSVEPVNEHLNEEDKKSGVFQVLADLEDMETTIGPRDPTPSAAMIRSEPEATPTKVTEQITLSPLKTRTKNEGGDKKLPTNTSVGNIASNIMSGLFKGKRKSTSTPPSPMTSPKKLEKRTSVPTSPSQHIGRNWLSSPGEKQLKAYNIIRRRKYDNDDYDMNLSQPSSPDESRNSTLTDTVKNFDRTMKIVDRPPHDDPPEEIGGGRRHAGDKIGGDGTAMYQTKAMHPTDWSCKSNDADSTGGGRRHAGDKIGEDGTAMYQAKAMHPTDWSCKSNDADSTGGSTIDEGKDEEKISNQYIFKNNMNLLLERGIDANDNTEESRDDIMDVTNFSTNLATKTSASTNRQMINDLAWLENKIASVRGEGRAANEETENVNENRRCN